MTLISSVESPLMLSESLASKEVVTLDCSIRVDLTRQSVRGVVQLPHGLQTEIRVLALCPDYMASVGERSRPLR